MNNPSAFPSGLRATSVKQEGNRYDGTYVAEYEAVGGMSLRDYFAAKAMQAIRADTEFALRHDPDQVADRAYEMADAMLKARG